MGLGEPPPSRPRPPQQYGMSSGMPMRLVILRVVGYGPGPSYAHAATPVTPLAQILRPFLGTVGSRSPQARPGSVASRAGPSLTVHSRGGVWWNRDRPYPGQYGNPSRKPAESSPPARRSEEDRIIAALGSNAGARPGNPVGRGSSASLKRKKRLHSRFGSHTINT